MASSITSRLTSTFLIMACLLFIIASVSPALAAPAAPVDSLSIEADVHATELPATEHTDAPANELAHHEIQKRGHGCWKGSSGDCNRYCIVTLHKRGGMCSGFLAQRCTCY